MTMAKARAAGTNKSDLIRDAYAANPGMKPKEIHALLVEKGVDVKQNLVYIVINKMKEKGAKKKTRKIVKAATAAAVAGNSDAVQTILKVRALAEEVGGYEALKELIDVLTG
jgi:ribosomal protein L12E/L44/L45/RPP1/RPP2